MAVIGHAFTSQTTQQTTTSGTPQVVLSLASGNFVAGKKYLILAYAQNAPISGINSGPFFNVRHQGTDFPGSLIVCAPFATSTYFVPFWLTVWTAVASEAIEIVLFNGDSSTNVGSDQITLLAINLSDDLVENTDWFYADTLTPVTYSDAFQTVVSKTFTVPAGGEEWLILGRMQHTVVSTARLATCRLNVDSGASTVPSLTHVGGGVFEQNPTAFARIAPLGSGSHTVLLEAKDDAIGSNNECDSATVFILRLSKFKEYFYQYTSGSTTLSSPSFGNVQTRTFTPTTTSDFWVGGYSSIVASSGSATYGGRVRVDSTDQPATQTSDARVIRQSLNNQNIEPFLVNTQVNLDTTSHTLDLDELCSAASTMSTTDRLVWAISMELAPTTPPASGPLPPGVVAGCA